jgi:hypothetical protein
MDVFGSTDKLERALLVLVGMLMPLVPLFVQIFIKTVLRTMRWPELPAHSESSIHKLHHPLEVLMKEELIYLGDLCWAWSGCYILWSHYLSRSSLKL